MRRPRPGWLLAALAVAGALLGGAWALRAAASEWAGNWKVRLLGNGQEVTVWLLRVEDRGDGKVRAKVLAASLPEFKDYRVRKAVIDHGALRVTLKSDASTFTLTAYPPRGEKSPKALFGSLGLGGQHDFARLDRTSADELPADADEAIQDSPAQKAYREALAESGADRVKALHQVEKKYPTDLLAFEAGLEALAQQAEEGAGEAALRAEAERALKLTAPYGPELEPRAVYSVARQLTGARKAPALALDYARRAARLLPRSAPPAERVGVLMTLATALRKAGQAREAAKVDERVAALDEVLDKEYLKTAVPFKPVPYGGRKASGGRGVLAELFTGAQCPPCVAADVAFDALLQTYKPRDVVLLQYHLHIPGPDPLTTPGSEARAEYYEVEGTPALRLDGKEGPAVGGPKDRGQAIYRKVREAVNEALEEKPGAQLKLTAARRGDQVELTAEVSGLKKTGDDVRLRFVLVEEVARYTGANGQRLHHHVVRAFPGGAKGFALARAADRQTARVDLGELKRSLNHYLDEQKFPPDYRPLTFGHLKAVAFVQDNKDKAVFQAAQADLPEAK